MAPIPGGDQTPSSCSWRRSTDRICSRTCRTTSAVPCVSRLRHCGRSIGKRKLRPTNNCGHIRKRRSSGA
eukprot:2847620-Pyramimonas_sp.AAC.1